ncbi:glycerophosphodiester phosphodiesterase domain-containing protein 4 [Microcaecilia unicolor]|uniref:Glycerophosphodiester phosphodiesterase domain-containing protein 4 n=1 Tax=Microcaecilia unicolor TaxID=1415580 RepID=A0A6P7XYV8_9AMPH|nr:glycerophosphodiester phosphodiesterase domain-containing protein 4 [Microcaecilia unicolor]
MGSTSISLKNLRLGKLKIVHRRLLQRYEHQPFISVLAGLYSCRWKRYQRERTEPGQCCCEKREYAFFLVLVGAFCLSMVFLYFWGEAQNDYNDFDWYAYGSVGYWFLWSLLILIVAAVLFTYIALLVVLAVCLLSEGQQLYLHWSHKIGTLVVVTFSIGAIGVLSNLWGEEWAAVLLSFQVTAPYLHLGAIAAMTLLSWPEALYFVRMKNRVSQIILLAPYLAILIFLYLIPLGMYSPCIREEGTLGPKPALIGHRGAPMLAPENTKMSFERTVELGGDGLETDVTISFDGIPFLMHDSTLQRTTNVQEVFPNWTSENAAMLPWEVLESLNAGKWFLRDKPFSGMRSLSYEEQKLAMNQSIFKLTDFLRLANSANKLVLFDLYRPPKMHPYRDSWINRTLEVIINESAINSNLILWLPNDMRSLVHSVAPGFQQTLGMKAPVEELLKNHIMNLNLPYSEMSSEDIRKYASVNISTNLYVISEPWLFSLAWCAGAHSVTTNSVHVLKKLNQPLFLMTPSRYSLMWILTDVVSALLITLVFVLHWWRERGLPCCSDNSILLENAMYNAFGTELDMSVSEDSDARSQPTTPNVLCSDETPKSVTNT